MATAEVLEKVVDAPKSTVGPTKEQREADAFIVQALAAKKTLKLVPEAGETARMLKVRLVHAAKRASAATPGGKVTVKSWDEVPGNPTSPVLFNISRG